MAKETDTPKDEGLQGNEKIEEAILELQKEPTPELLAHVLTVIRRRMKEGGRNGGSRRCEAGAVD